MLYLLTRRQLGICVKKSISWIRDGGVERLTVDHGDFRDFSHWMEKFAANRRREGETDCFLHKAIELGLDLLNEIRELLVKVSAEFDYKMELFQTLAKTKAFDAQQQRLADDLICNVAGCNGMVGDVLNIICPTVEKEQDMEMLTGAFFYARMSVYDACGELLDERERKDDDVKDAVSSFCCNASYSNVPEAMHKWRDGIVVD